MEQIPDAPWIREAERDGMPSAEPVFCPVCDEECETIYKDMFNEVFGCEHCISSTDAYEWEENQKEASRPDWADE